MYKTARPKVLLTNTDRWAGPARLAIALSEVGFEVSALCPTPGHPIVKTGCVHQVFPYSGFKPFKSIRSAITESQPHLVIPCDDLAVQHLHALYAEGEAASAELLTSLIERSLGSPSSYAVASSRYELLEIARAQGVRCPQTLLIKTPEDLQTLERQIGFPCVLKADGTWGGRGVKVVQTLDEAVDAYVSLHEQPGIARVTSRVLLNRDRAWLRSWWSQAHPVITAQEFVNGRPANCAVVCHEGEILAGIAVEVLSSEGQTGPANVVKVVDSDAMLSAARAVASQLGLSGFFGLDFMIDNCGATYLIEMNPRCTPLCHLQLGAGRDMVSALWETLAGHPAPTRRPVTDLDTIAYFPRGLESQEKLGEESFLDIPKNHPKLIAELLHPWSGRTWLGQLLDRIRAVRPRAKAADACVFHTPANDRTVKC